MVAKEINLNTESLKRKQSFLRFRKDNFLNFVIILKRSLSWDNKCKFRSTQSNKKISKIKAKKANASIEEKKSKNLNKQKYRKELN